MTLPGGNYWLIEKTTYDNEKQTVHYSMVKSGAPGQTLVAKLQYHLFDWKDAFEWLAAAGFSRQSLKVSQFRHWPYLVVACRKES